MGTLAVMDDLAAGVRVCKSCRVELPIERFPRGEGYVDGRRPVCTGCVSAKRQARRRANPEAARAEYRRDNSRPSARARSARYHAKRSHDPAFKEDRRQRERARRAANPERVRQLERHQPSRSTPEGKARRKAQFDVWRQANYERWLATTRLATAARRARLRQADTRSVTKRDIIRLAERQRHCCAYCAQPTLLEVDHVVPIARGGRHAIGNIALACRRCNAVKSDRLLSEWRHGRGRTETPSVRSVARAPRRTGLTTEEVA